MTLWVKRPGLILALALLTFACEEPGEIGLDINPENGDFVAKFEELFLDNSVLLYEDILADNSTRIDSAERITSGGRLFAGTFANESFGKMQAKGYASLLLGSVGFANDTAGFVFDSLILNLKIDYLYGNSLTGVKRIFIHELSEPLELDKLYLTKDESLYINDFVGEFNVDFSRFDTVQVDTVITTRLSDELGERFLLEAEQNKTSYTNNDEFRKFYNGFAFVADESNDMVTGIIPDHQSSFARMHFHNATDTSSFDFIFQDLDTMPGNITKYYNNITLDRSESPLGVITDYYSEYQIDSDYAYMQASAGVFTKLSMGNYLSFLDTIDFLVINRAEIEIPVVEYNDQSIPSLSIEMYVADENNRFVESFVNGRPHPVYQVLPDGKLLFKKDIEENKGVFFANITSYIQLLASGEISESELLLGQSSLWNSVISINQSIIKKDSISLKIYYSTLKN